ncbi:TetR/AcrR family transcriptional regulator [Xanthomonas theicola]|uniref:TetR family transcriptional regulator n=1 Tax=Xanthomonas theicola TaxID=56464 RepID=A0A2S6ZBX1_9XANT|nr:TetR/AcrR family transcriptional regulator [Xanthomonas theicola]PPT86759.1 TetR family transcriptional regulator [Xanthomonas theicola]
MDLRADAAQRRHLLLDAADEVFCEHGVLAPLERVIERSGLGRATLYRHFADRPALMLALLERGLDGLECCARDIGVRPDGLFLLLRDIAEHIAMSAPLSDYWRSMPRDHPAVEAARARLTAVLAPLLRCGIDAGRCRQDLDIGDLVLLLDMLGACQRGQDGAERKALALRGWWLLCHALTAPAPVAAAAR